ncbi:MAG: DUF3015 family protein [Oligoflexales bacterium]
MKNFLLLSCFTMLSQFASAANEVFFLSTSTTSTAVGYMFYTLIQNGGSPEQEMAKFIQDNELHLVQEIATGRGSSLEALANLAGVQGVQNKFDFYHKVKDHIEVLFPVDQSIESHVLAKKILVLSRRA